jgi:hypothetical protein
LPTLSFFSFRDFKGLRIWDLRAKEPAIVWSEVPVSVVRFYNNRVFLGTLSTTRNTLLEFDLVKVNSKISICLFGFFFFLIFEFEGDVGPTSFMTKNAISCMNFHKDKIGVGCFNGTIDLFSLNGGKHKKNLK